MSLWIFNLGNMDYLEYNYNVWYYVFPLSPSHVQQKMSECIGIGTINRYIYIHGIYWTGLFFYKRTILL